MLPDLISFTLYRFETNIRAAAVLGLIGAGGIGFDVSEYLLHNPAIPQPQPLADWQREWGLDPQPNYDTEGGMVRPEMHPPYRQIYLLQRKSTPVGAGLGKTSGWVHRAQLKKHGVRMLRSVNYDAITPEGLCGGINIYHNHAIIFTVPLILESAMQ